MKFEANFHLHKLFLGSLLSARRNVNLCIRGVTKWKVILHEETEFWLSLVNFFWVRTTRICCLQLQSPNMIYLEPLAKTPPPPSSKRVNNENEYDKHSLKMKNERVTDQTSDKQHEKKNRYHWEEYKTDLSDSYVAEYSIYSPAVESQRLHVQSMLHQQCRPLFSLRQRSATACSAEPVVQRAVASVCLPSHPRSTDPH